MRCVGFLLAFALLTISVGAGLFLSSGNALRGQVTPPHFHIFMKEVGTSDSPFINISENTNFAISTPYSTLIAFLIAVPSTRWMDLPLDNTLIRVSAKKDGQEVMDGVENSAEVNAAAVFADSPYPPSCSLEHPCLTSLVLMSAAPGIPGTYNITISANDGTDATSAAFTWTVLPEEPNGSTSSKEVISPSPSSTPTETSSSEDIQASSAASPSDSCGNCICDASETRDTCPWDCDTTRSGGDCFSDSSSAPGSTASSSQASSVASAPVSSQASSVASAPVSSQASSVASTPVSSPAPSSTASSARQSQASVACGNGVREEGELCDKQDLGGVTCLTLGYDGGPLACSASCTFDVGLCEEKDTQKKVFCCDVITQSTTPVSFFLKVYIPSLWKKLEGGPLCRASVFVQSFEQAKVFCDRLPQEEEKRPIAPPDSGKGIGGDGSSDAADDDGDGGGGDGEDGIGGNECCVASDGTIGPVPPPPSTFAGQAWAAAKEAAEWVIDLFKDVELNPRCGGGAVLAMGAQCGGGEEGGGGGQIGECADGMDNDTDDFVDADDPDCSDFDGENYTYNPQRFERPCEMGEAMGNLPMASLLAQGAPCNPPRPGSCGNNRIEPPEECDYNERDPDSPNIGNLTCAYLGGKNPEGRVKCLRTCKLDLSRCDIPKVDATRRVACDTRPGKGPSCFMVYPDFNDPLAIGKLFPYLPVAGESLAHCKSLCTQDRFCCDRYSGTYKNFPATLADPSPCTSKQTDPAFTFPSGTELLGSPGVTSFLSKIESNTSPASSCPKLTLCCRQDTGTWFNATGNSCAIDWPNDPLATLPIEQPLHIVFRSPYGKPPLPPGTASYCYRKAFCYIPWLGACRSELAPLNPEKFTITCDRAIDRSFVESPDNPPQEPEFNFTAEGLAACKASIPRSACGDGRITPPEQCEPSLPHSCPDGKVCGPPESLQPCICDEPRCGNGILEGTEQCEVGIPCQNAPDECNLNTCACSLPPPPPPAGRGGEWHWVFSSGTYPLCRRSPISVPWAPYSVAAPYNNPHVPVSPQFLAASATRTPGKRVYNSPAVGFPADQTTPNKPTCPPMLALVTLGALSNVPPQFYIPPRCSPLTADNVWTIFKRPVQSNLTYGFALFSANGNAAWTNTSSPIEEEYTKWTQQGCP